MKVQVDVSLGDTVGLLMVNLSGNPQLNKVSEVLSVEDAPED